MKTKDLQMLIRWMVVLFICLLLLPAAMQLTKAEELGLTWTAPTQDQECTTTGPLASPIASYRIWQLVGTVQAPTTAFTMGGLLPGEYEYKATAINEAGAESMLSAEAVKQIGPLVVGADTRVYSTLRSGGKFLLVALGTIPEGTECSAEYRVSGELPNNEGVAEAYVVPFADVVWSGTVETQTPVARCL